MNKEELFEVIEDIDAKHVKAAREPLPKKPVWKRRWVQAVAAILAVVIVGGILLRPGEGPLVTSAYAVAEARYPEMAQYPGEDGDFDAWWEDIVAQRGPEGYADGLEGFFTASIQEFLSGADGENRVYSPLNVYMALAMLAELTDGDSRQQILNLLGSGNIEALRAQANDLWNANYRNDGATTSVLAGSVWLNEDVEFHKDALKTLAENYYASSYQGTMGSDEFNRALQDWLNEQTGGLLEEQAGQQELNADTVLALAATVYFKAKWSFKFSQDKTTEDVFHGADGDVTAQFMHQSDEKNYYWGGTFSAVAQGLENAGKMWFILPDEGVTVDELLSDGEVMEFILSRGQWENGKFLIVHESIPKFDVSSTMELSEGLQALGVTEVFRPDSADFSPVTDAAPVWVSQADHAARVVIDEDGCTAAAYTVMSETGSTMPPTEEVDFVVDRPFLFVLTGIDGLPLFVGVVNNP